MKKMFLAIGFVLLAGIAGAQTTQSQCNADITSAGPALTTGLITTTYNDTTVVDGVAYGYIVTAVDPWGVACSNQLLNVTIPTTGTHSVTLNWVASATSGVTYSVFRATPPASPAGLAATVN